MQEILWQLIGKRNTQYYNKPSLKIHAIVDSNRTPISIDISECTDHDSNYIENLIKNKYVDNNRFNNNCTTFLADSAK